MAKARPGGEVRESRLTARLERLVDSTAGRLALLLGFAVVLWLLSALIARALGAFPTFGEALWSGIQHLLDPGSLGDDDSDAQRFVGLGQVLTGIVLVVGLALTVLSDLVDRMVSRLGEIDPPVVAEGHLLVIGEGEALPSILGQLAESEAGARAVVLVPPDSGERRRALEHRLAETVPSLDLSVVSGDAYEPSGLERGSASAARSIVVLSPPSADDDVSDVLTITVAAKLSTVLEGAARPPHVGVEIRRGLNADSIWELFPPSFDAVVRDRSIGGLLGLAMANPSFSEILGSASSAADSSRPFAIAAGELAGSRFDELVGRLDGALPIGVLEGGASDRIRLVPEPGRILGATDRVVVLTASARDVRRRPRREPRAAGAPKVGGPLPPPRPLLVGWSPTAAGYVEAVARMTRGGAGHAISVLAPTDPRPAAMEIDWHRGDPGDPAALREVLAAVSPEVALIASVPGPADPRVADARAALTALHLCRAAGERPLALLVEQRGGERAVALEEADPRIRIVSAAAIAGHAIALAAVDPDALAVQEAMAAPGMRLERRPLSGGAGGDGAGGAGGGIRFADVYRALLAEGALPLSVARRGLALDILRSERPALAPGDELLVLSRRDA